jgi:transposase
MSAAVKLTRLDHTTAEFRQAAAACVDSDAARRMLTLAIVREGGSRADAARLCGMDRQTLRDWVHCYNELGLIGLSDKAGRRGPKPRLSTDQAQLVAEMVRKGPDLAEDGVVRWRRIDLARSIQAKLGVRLAERTVGTILRGGGEEHFRAGDDFEAARMMLPHPGFVIVEPVEMFEQFHVTFEGERRVSPMAWNGARDMPVRR